VSATFAIEDVFT